MVNSSPQVSTPTRGWPAGIGPGSRPRPDPTPSMPAVPARRGARGGLHAQRSRRSTTRVSSRSHTSDQGPVAALGPVEYVHPRGRSCMKSKSRITSARLAAGHARLALRDVDAVARRRWLGLADAALLGAARAAGQLRRVLDVGLRCRRRRRHEHPCHRDGQSPCLHPTCLPCRRNASRSVEPKSEAKRPKAALSGARWKRAGGRGVGTERGRAGAGGANLDKVVSRLRYAAPHA